MVMTTLRICVDAVKEIPSFAARASLDGGHILEFKLGHRYAPFEDPLDLVSFCSRARDYPDTQRARLILDKLDISYLIIERAMVEVPERITEERPSSSRVVDEGLLRSSDDGAGAGKIISGTTPDRIDRQVARVIPDELSANSIKRRRYNASASLNL